MPELKLISISEGQSSPSREWGITSAKASSLSSETASSVALSLAPTAPIVMIASAKIDNINNLLIFILITCIILFTKYTIYNLII